MPEPGENRDLVLAPGSYAYVQADTSGVVKVHHGPTVVTLSGQDRSVRFDPTSRQFIRCQQDDAVCPNVWAGEGDYVILDNPCHGDVHPEEGGARVLPQPGLDMGKRVVIPGPCTFALWPGQSAQTVPGHHLLSNQYLLVRVYNEQAARDNWQRGVSTVVEGESEEENKDKGPQPAPLSGIDPATLKLGQLIIIPGNQISFYIPPTGIEVVPDRDGEFVRDAVTLERLEYCILVDEDGEKRYERGPAVVFPRPSEQFVKDHKKRRKYKAIELTKMAALHIKVIADYKDDDDDGREYKAGDELFITGEKQSIYYPRIEHSIIRYGDRRKHYAVAVPKGEGRYVMDRNNGDIATEHGPQMLLPDPRDKVIVQRILSPKEVELWYPGNAEAMQHNMNLRSAAEREGGKAATRGYVPEARVRSATRGLESYAAAAERDDLSVGEAVSEEIASATFGRSQKYTPPRTLTLDTKFDGVPAINVWTGFAVQVVNKEGQRRVVEGPANILLDYDESLEVLEMSTGKPKNTDNLLQSVYLRTKNNKVSDIVDIETQDHVRIKIKISLLVDFEGDPTKWFHAENYVKLLCDHVRSVLKGRIQKIKVEDLYNSHVEVVRDTILGESVEGSRPGMTFDENGMVVKDVEILNFEIQNEHIAQLLDDAQFDTVRNNIELETAERELAKNQRQEEINRETAAAASATRMHSISLQKHQEEAQSELEQDRIATRLEEAEKRKAMSEAEEAVNTLIHMSELDRQQTAAKLSQSIEDGKNQAYAARLMADAEAQIKRFDAAKGQLSEAILALGREDVAVKVAQATSVQQLLGGGNLVEIFTKIFKGTKMEGMFDQLGDILEPMGSRE